MDSSVVPAWLYSDELIPAAQQILDRVTAHGAWVPSLWRLEVANSLQIGVRRGRISADFRDAALTDLALLHILTDPDTDVHGLRHYVWPIGTSSHSTTLPILSWRSALIAAGHAGSGATGGHK